MDLPPSDRSYALAGLGDDLDARAKPQPGSPPAAPETLDLALIFRDHHAQLVRIALLLVGDRPTAEDVVQDVFARLCDPGRRLQPATGLAYVRAAVVNGCRSVQRRRILTRRLEGARDVLRRDSQESAEYAALLAEDRRQVLAALAALPHRRREVLVLRFYLNLPVAEVATMLGISQGTVKSTAARGLEALGRQLREDS
jgi:RNA polymerase sigma factor (sigma-70 family)